MASPPLSVVIFFVNQCQQTAWNEVRFLFHIATSRNDPPLCQVSKVLSKDTLITVDISQMNIPKVYHLVKT